MRPSNNELNFGTFGTPALTPVVASNQASIAQWATDIIRASFQVVATGTPTGSIQAQASNDFAYGLPRNQFQPTNWSNIGSSVAVTAAGAYLIPEIECSYEYLRLIYTSTATGVQTIAPIADTGVLQSQTITTVADVSGSLNNKYLLLSSINTTTKAQKDFYIWFNINSAGTDPLIAGRTAIPITGATNVSANTLATSIRSALNALSGDFTAAGTNAAVIVSNVAPGPVTAAVDGTAATGFTFGSATAGVASNLNNTYFLLSDASSAHLYYVWFNVSSIGTDPLIAGRTAVPITIVAGDTAATIGTALASAIAALNSTNSFTTSGTTTVTVTNKTAGPFTPIADGTPPTGFTFAVTTGSGVISGRICAKGL